MPVLMYSSTAAGTEGGLQSRAESKVVGPNYRAIKIWPENIFARDIRRFLICRKGFLPRDVILTPKFQQNRYDVSALEFMIDGRKVTMGVTDYDSNTKRRARRHLHAFVQGTPKVLLKAFKMICEGRDAIMGERADRGARDRCDRSSSSHEAYVGG